MNRKLRALFGLGMAALAISGVGGGGASATSGGHFTSEVDHTLLTGTESTEFIGTTRHTIQFYAIGQVGKCHSATYDGTLPAKTVTEVTITAQYDNCTINNKDAIEVTMNGCDYLFTIRPDNVETELSTVHLKCPGGKEIEIHTPNCTLAIPAQTVEGAGYSQIMIAGKHAITLEVSTGPLTYSRHGACGILGTHAKDAKIEGSVTVHAYVGSEAIALTATGSS